MKSQIQTNNVNSTELWVELSEQQSSELVGGSYTGDIIQGIGNLSTEEIGRNLGEVIIGAPIAVASAAVLDAGKAIGNFFSNLF
jgi:hypothetical protein